MVAKWAGTRPAARDAASAHCGECVWHAAIGLAAAGHLSPCCLWALDSSSTASSRNLPLCWSLRLTCFLLRLLSGNILLADSKSHSSVEEAGGEAPPPGQYERFETLHPTFFGILTNRKHVWMLEPKKETYICPVQILRTPHFPQHAHGETRWGELIDKICNLVWGTGSTDCAVSI